MKAARPFRERPWWASRFILALTCFVATLGLSGLNIVREFDHRINDGLFRLRNYTTGSSSVTIVVIDDASLAMEGRWPWHRSILAHLMDAIQASHPRAIGLDILLSEPSDENDDHALAASIARAGNVVLPMKLSTSATGSLWVEPQLIFSQVAAGVGHVQATLDADGVCRRIPDEEMSIHGIVPMMAQELVTIGDKPKTRYIKNIFPQVLLPNQQTIDYRGLNAGEEPRKPFQVISAASILDGHSYSFSHRIVLVGFAGSGLEDELLTPLNYRYPAAGVFIQANMADTLYRHRIITNENLFIQLLIILGLCLLGSIAIQSHKWMNTALWILCATSVTYLSCYLCFIIWGIHFHPGVAIISEVLVVPLGQLQHILVLQAMIGGSLEHLKEQSRNLPLHLPRLLEYSGSGEASLEHGLTNAESKINVIAETGERILVISAFQQTLLEAMRDGIAVFGADGTLLFANPVWDSFLEQCSWDKEASWAHLLCALHSDAAGVKTPQDAENQPQAYLTKAMGKELVIANHLWRISLVKLSTIASTRELYMALCADLTPQQERDQARQQALQFITHELRTPLVSLQGFAELLQRYPEQAKAAGAAEIIYKESERLVALTSMYLECLRLETTLPTVSPTWTNAETLILHAAEIARPLCAAFNKRINPILPQRKIELYVDVALVAGALLNLIANAAKYGDEKSEVIIMVGDLEAATTLSVCNKGTRIPQDELLRLFTPQYRMPQNAEGRTGWGIGLAFVKRVMDMHRGDVTVTSDDQDTCFRLMFPNSKPARNPAI